MQYNLPALAPLQWGAAVLGAAIVGLAKAGLAGVNGLYVGLFALVMPSVRQSTGVVLPLIMFGDWLAVAAYRRHLRWRNLARLFPWAAAGVVLGYAALGHWSDRWIKTAVGLIILAMAVLSYWRRWRGAAEPAVATPALRADQIHWVQGALMGLVAGFATLLANAAGPLMAIYLVTMRLPKMEYVGTTAIFFALLNLFKLPFMIHLGLVSVPSFDFDLVLFPAVLGGVAMGRWLLLRINQRLFEELALGLSALTGIALLL
jgi:uncharacterized membrane protein YfcA